MNNSLILNPPFVLKNSLFLKGKFTLRRFYSIGILLIIILSVFYVFQANIDVSKKYLVRQYESELNQILNKNQNLIISSVHLNSLDDVAALLEKPVQPGELSFEKIDKIHYIQILDTRFVAKQ